MPKKKAIGWLAGKAGGLFAKKTAAKTATAAANKTAAKKTAKTLSVKASTPGQGLRTLNDAPKNKVPKFIPKKKATKAGSDTLNIKGGFFKQQKTDPVTGKFVTKNGKPVMEWTRAGKTVKNTALITGGGAAAYHAGSDLLDGVAKKEIREDATLLQRGAHMLGSGGRVVVDTGSELVGQAAGTAVGLAGDIVNNAAGGLFKGLNLKGLNLGTILKVGGLGVAGFVGIPKLCGVIADAKDKKHEKEIAAEEARTAAESDVGGKDDDIKELMKMQMMMNMAQMPKPVVAAESTPSNSGHLPIENSNHFQDKK